MKIIARMAVSILIVAIAGVKLSTRAADKPAPPPTDDELRRSLDAKAGDDYDRELLGGATTPKPAARQDAPAPDEKRLRRELGPAATPEDQKQDPLLVIARQMREAQRLIEKNEVGDDTQFLQRQIVSDLDKLLEQARKSCSGGQCKPGEKPQEVAGRKPVEQPKPKASNKPGKGATTKPGERAARESDPNIKQKAKEGDSDPAVARELMTRIIMGLDLPPKEREQMLQLAPEEFLPKYQQQIEDYYRRLSEEKPKPRVE